MKKLHYISGIIITIFILTHLLNHVLSLYSVDYHIQSMDVFRKIYRHTLIEPILLSAIVVQIFSGIRLFFKKRKIATNFFEKLQLWSGMYLAVFFVFHLTAVFVGRLVLNLDTNIYFGVAGLNTFPFLLFFVPYYGLAIIAFFGHVSAIHSIKMKYNIIGIRPNQQAYMILFVGLLFSVLVLYGLTNSFNGIDIPKEYQIIIGK